MSQQRVVINEMREEDLPFLIGLWHTPDVMRYADEFPRLRGWSRSDDPLSAWETYRAMRASLGPGYVQLMIRLREGPLIGESFFVPLPEGYTFGRWEQPPDTVCLMGDLKLLPAHWGQGLGSEAMRHVVAWLFDRTDAGLLVVPPHRKNPAAERVYEKAGFELFRGMRSWRNHKVMTLSRAEYEDRPESSSEQLN